MSFSFGIKKAVTPTEFMLSCPFRFGMDGTVFIHLFITHFYKKILTDCVHRTAGLTDEQKATLWDSSVATEQNEGLISLLAEALYGKAEICLVYKNGVVREADEEEKELIKENRLNDYGVCVNFTKYALTDMLRVFAGMLLAILQSANTGMNVAKALQIGIADLRQTVADGNKEEAIAQAKAINDSLKEGKSILKDAADVVSATPFDSEPMEKSLQVFFGLLSFFTGFNATYLAGDLVSGLSGTGEGNEIAIERALANYFNMLLKPVLDALFKVSVKFKSNNWRKLAEIASLLPTLEVTELIDTDTKKALLKEILE